MTLETNPHEEHMKHVLQVDQLQTTLYQGLLHCKRQNYCEQATQESSVYISFWVMTRKQISSLFYLIFP